MDGIVVTIICTDDCIYSKQSSEKVRYIFEFNYGRCEPIESWIIQKSLLTILGTEKRKKRIFDERSILPHHKAVSRTRKVFT